MNIFVLRHGQTDLNIQGRFQGRRGLPLNSRGVEQAKESAEKLKSVSFDEIYSSSCERAIQTAQIAACADIADIIIDERINVFDLGSADGEIITADKVERYGIVPKSDLFCGVENPEAFYARVCDFMDGLLAKHRKNRESFTLLSSLSDICNDGGACGGDDVNVLISGHKCTTGAVSAYFEGLPDDGDFFSMSSKNGKFKVYSDLTR